MSEHESDNTHDDKSDVSDHQGGASLRAAFQAHTKANADAARPVSREACPSPEALELLARGATAGDPNLQQLEHVLRCTSCHAEFALLRSIAEAEAADRLRVTDTQPTGATKSRAVSRTAPRMWSLRNLAAAALVLVAVGIGGQRLRQSRGSIVRGDPAEVSLVAPMQEVAESLPVFVWHAVPGAVRYAFELVDSAGVVILARETSDSTLTLSESEAALLRKHAAADWMVTARRVDGNERRSRVVRLRVR